MRVFLITTIYCFILGTPSVSRAQHGYWEWAKSCTDQGLSETNKVAVDRNGNVYATGTFTGELAIGTVLLQSKGKSDAFIIKYNSAGQLVWARGLGGLEDDAGVGITVDSNDNVYVTGSYIDTFTDGNSGIKGFGEEDVFIVKYDGTGNLKWLQRGGSIYQERPVDIKADGFGNIYIAGEFGNYPGSPKPDSAFAYFGTDTLLGLGGREIYLVKYDTIGNVVWAKGIGGELGKETMGSIALDVYGNISMGGAFSSYIELDHITLMSTSVGFVVGNMFIAKFNNFGQVLWANSASGNKSTGGIDAGAVWWGYVACDESGNVYATGSYFNCDMLFPGTTLKEIEGYDIFIAKYSASGSLVWAKNAGGYSPDYANGIAVNNNELYITGEYDKTGASVIGGDTLEFGAGPDLFIGKYDLDGNGIWGISTGGEGRDYARCIATGNNGRVYIGGGFNSGAATFGSHFISSGNDYNMFVAAYHGFPTGINGNNSTAAFRVYPNPTDRYLIVEGAAQGTIIQLYNVMGQEVYQSTITKHTETVNTAQLQPGVYILNLTDALGNKDTRRIVKQ